MSWKTPARVGVTEANPAMMSRAINIHFYDPEWMIAHFEVPSDEKFYTKWLKHHQAQRDVDQSTPSHEM